mgnify:CR=1 FL=1
MFRLRENSISLEKNRQVSLKKCIHALICIEFFLILLHLFLFLRTNNHYRIKKIIIDGSHYTSPGKIINSMNFSQDANIFNINLESIGKILERNIWIESSNVKIKYPGVLDISINERAEPTWPLPPPNKHLTTYFLKNFDLLSSLIANSGLIRLIFYELIG